MAVNVFPCVWVAPSWSWVRRGPDSRQSSEGAGSGCSGDSDAGSSIRPVESLLMGPPGSASQSRTLPSLLLPPLPRLSLAVAPLVPGSKPRCPRACVPSAPTLSSGMAAAPFSAEASPVCTVRAPGVGPAAGSVPPGLCPPPAAAASEAPGGWSRRDLCAVTPASRGGRQRHAWWPLPGRWPPETLLCVPARSCPGCPGGWAFLLVRAAGTGGFPGPAPQGCLLT